MGTIYVGVGEIAISNQPQTVIRTLALGSCVAVVVWVPDTQAVGLLHVALPESSINPKMASERPGMFADTGIPKMILEMEKKGYLPYGHIIVKLVGGASIMDPNDTFNIGKRNALAIKKVLWNLRLGAIAEDLGGNFSRSVAVETSTGRIVLSSPGRGEWEI